MSAAHVPTNPVQALSMEEKIRFRAYLIFEERGEEHGHDLDDWLQAEVEILDDKLSVPAVRVTPIRATPAKKARTRRTSI